MKPFARTLATFVEVQVLGLCLRLEGSPLPRQSWAGSGFLLLRVVPLPARFGTTVCSGAGA
jgi:hypothetical protein